MSGLRDELARVIHVAYCDEGWHGPEYGDVECSLIGNNRDLEAADAVLDFLAPWSCSHCGPHPASTATWCAAGCGRDYQTMSRVSGLQENP